MSIYQHRPTTSPTDARRISEETLQPFDQRLDELELAFAAVWKLLKTQHGLTDEQLQQAMHSIDIADGIEDGQIGHAARHCGKCKRQLLLRNGKRCTWCGEPVPPAFTGV